MGEVGKADEGQGGKVTSEGGGEGRGGEGEQG